MPDHRPLTERTAGVLGEYRKQLLTQGIPTEAVAAIVFDLAQQLHKGVTLDGATAAAPLTADAVASAGAERRLRREAELARRNGS